MEMNSSIQTTRSEADNSYSMDIILKHAYNSYRKEVKALRKEISQLKNSNLTNGCSNCALMKEALSVEEGKHLIAIGQYKLKIAKLENMLRNQNSNHFEDIKIKLDGQEEKGIRKENILPSQIVSPKNTLTNGDVLAPATPDAEMEMPTEAPKYPGTQPMIIPETLHFTQHINEDSYKLRNEHPETQTPPKVPHSKLRRKFKDDDSAKFLCSQKMFKTESRETEKERMDKYLEDDSENLSKVSQWLLTQEDIVVPQFENSHKKNYKENGLNSKASDSTILVSNARLGSSLHRKKNPEKKINVHAGIDRPCTFVQGAKPENCFGKTSQVKQTGNSQMPNASTPISKSDHINEKSSKSNERTECTQNHQLSVDLDETMIIDQFKIKVPNHCINSKFEQKVDSVCDQNPIINKESQSFNYGDYNADESLDLLMEIAKPSPPRNQQKRIPKHSDCKMTINLDKLNSCRNINLDKMNSCRNTPPENKSEPKFDRLPLKEFHGYKYQESPVRKQRDREKLRGFQCQECARYYKDLGPKEKEEKLKQCSRHRGNFSPPPTTPENYWEIAYPSTLECKRRGYLNETQKIELKSHRKRPLFERQD